MRKNIKRLTVVLLGIALIVSAVMLVHHRKSELKNMPRPDLRPIPVYVKTVQYGILEVDEHYLGSIEPVAESVISAQATGYLMSIEKDVGDWLQSGEKLAAIDDRILIRQKYALEAELAGAHEDVDVKKVIKERRKELVKHKATARENFDEANLAFELAVSRVQRLEQELEALKVSLGFTSIRSIYSGIITERMKDAGDMVMPGTPVIRIEDPKQGYKVLVHIPQETILLLSDNSPVYLTHGRELIKTKIYRVHPAITTGHLATIEIRVPDRPFSLPSYATLGVNLIVDSPEGYIVPMDCIVEMETGAMVFEVKETQEVQPVPITLLGQNKNRGVVEGDINPESLLAAGPESMLLQLSRNSKIMPIFGDSQ